MGVLGDGQGIECTTCGGTSTLKRDGEEDTVCPHCEEGRVLKVDAEQVDADYYEACLCVMRAREHTWTPNDWLSQPMWFYVVWQFLTPYLAGEFEERRPTDD